MRQEVNKGTEKSRKLVFAAFMVALGLLLPFLTGQVAFGTMLLPMHFPVLIGGLLLGPFWGLLIGAVTPLLRSVLFGMPVMMPMAVGMAFELAAYGGLSGLLYRRCRMNLYVSLIASMLGGRVIWGVVSVFLYGILQKGFGMQMFVSSAFLNAMPGIVLQIILVPLIVKALQKAGAVGTGLK